MLENIIEAERPDALLPTVGGQTALNMAMAHGSGLLERYGVQLIGAQPERHRGARTASCSRPSWKIGPGRAAAASPTRMAEARGR